MTKINEKAERAALAQQVAVPEFADTKDRLLVALECAGAAESTLRRLVDECENDGILGWEDRMMGLIQEANRLLAAAPEAPASSSEARC